MVIKMDEQHDQYLNEDTKIKKNITINNFPKLYPCSYFYSHLYLYSLSGQRPIDVVPSDEKEVNNRIRVILHCPTVFNNGD
jgi:hypothetical protein